jgi:hypothetical protein
MRRGFLVGALFLLGTSQPSTAQNQLELPYTIIFSDAKGATHFKIEHLTWKETQTTGNLPVFITPFSDAGKIGFVRIPHGYQQDWHPAPPKQYVIVISGIGEIEVADGERRTFEPGSILLVTDTEGPGHRTSAVGDHDILLAFVPLP